MRVLIFRLFEILFGYCLKHNRYTRCCPQCWIESRMDHPALVHPEAKKGGR